MGNILPFACISQGTIGIQENCGSYAGELDSGCHVLIPILQTVAHTLNMRQQQIIVNVDTKTADNVFCRIQVGIVYVIARNKIFDATYSVQDIQGMISSYVQNEVRSKLAALTLDQAFQQKEELSSVIKDRLDCELANNGYTFIAVIINDVEPDRQVRDAMNEINRQERLRQAAIAQAEGQKAAQIAKAEADATTMKLIGTGLANQRKEIVGGLKDSVVSFLDGVHSTDTDKVMDTILMIQYYDTLKSLGHDGKSNVIFAPLPRTLPEMDSKLLSSQLMNSHV